ncbi:MAG: hypothetical protein NTZ95_04935 [Candidatus Omnitrophica bacterium]|nr:hypothetical protein [Candidatus Omnitrophota bacterium]
MVKKILFTGFIVMLTAWQAAGAETVDISRYLAKGNPIKVYIPGVTNDSGQAQIIADDFKKVLESSIRNRRSVKFEIASDPLASDFQIAAVIKKYSYSKTDPINSFAGPSALALDALTTENYAEMGVDFTITSTGSGKIVWKDNVFDYIERTMTPAESVPMVYDKIARKFLWKSFGKGK